MNEKREDTVYSVTASIINDLERERENSSGKAILAELRKSVSRSISQSLVIWPLLFKHLPESFLNEEGNLSKEEKSILNALQLYALHSQGSSDSVNLSENEFYKNMGYSLGFLRTGENSLAIDRRFNAMITASTYEELIYYLRQLINLLKSKSTAKINYPKLANDLFSFLLGYDEKIRISWAKSYYGKNLKGEDNEQ